MTDHERRSAHRLFRASIAVFVITLLVAAVPFVLTRQLVNEQDKRVLAANADDLVDGITGFVRANSTALRTVALAIRNDSSRNSFNVSASAIIDSGSYSYLALVDTTTNPPRVIYDAGTPSSNALVTEPQPRRSITQLSVDRPIQTTGVYRNNGTKYLAFTYGPPALPNGQALIGETALDRSDVKVNETVLGLRNETESALYSGPVSNQNLVLTNAESLPLEGKIASRPVLVGGDQWTLVVHERRPLADVLSRAVPWIIISSALIIAFLSSLTVNTLISRRNTALNLARERSRENVSILEAAGEAFISMDTDGRIQRWSREAENLFGYKANEVIGKQVAETIVPPDLRRRHSAGLRRYVTTGEGVVINNRIEIDAIHKDGHTIPVELAVWESSSDGHRSFSAITHDITERRAAAERLAEVTQQALQASQLKSEFLANMSHEIRTPMNGVIGMTSLLMQSDLTPEQREQAQLVQSSADALLTVINDILDFSKIESGKLAIANNPFVVRKVIDEVVHLFDGPVRQKRLRLHVDVDSGVPEAVMGDAGRLRQVLLNIVGNAVKFTAEGSVTIACDLQETRNGSLLSFEITDTGIGVAPESRGRLFESFEQVDMSSARRHEGTGLGLAISSRLVELMGGDIGVRSELGAGSTFWFNIMVQSADESPIELDESRSIRPNDDRRANVLVVEDNLVNQRVASLTLERLSCEVDIAGDGAHALLLTNDKIYDVIFMDCQMPGMDGYQATREIRSSKGPNRQTPIIAMTASAMSGDREHALESGMDDYLAKPVKMDDFTKILGKWLVKKTSAATTQMVRSLPVEPDVAEDTLSELRERTADNPNVYAGIINTYLRQASDLIEQIHRADAESNRETLGMLAHKLRGSSATVGALRVARLCTDIEVILADSHSDRMPGVINELDQALVDVKQVFGRQLSEKR